MQPISVQESAQGISEVLKHIERGIQCVREGNHTNAIAHLMWASQQLHIYSPDLGATLDAFIQTYECYQQAEQELHKSSQHFAMARLEHEQRLDNLEALLQSGSGHSYAGQPLTHMVQYSEQPSLDMPDTDRALRLVKRHESMLPPLHITCFGRFEVKRSGEPVAPCHNRNGQTILRYLSAHPRHRESADILMELLWPDDSAEVARHKLHCAASALRCTLNADYVGQKGAGYIVHDENVYGLNLAAHIEIDADEFLAYYASGQRAGGDAAIHQFEAACQLYTGMFLPEDLYADWSFIRREQLTQAYLAMCSVLAMRYMSHGNFDMAASWTLKILEEDRCNEKAYQQLMYAYVALGRRAEALHQYQRCERILSEELGAQPLPETKSLFERILRGTTGDEVPWEIPEALSR